MRKNLRSQYHPLYFLASLGSGGLAVSFFMYLMFMVKHPKTPMPTFEHIFPALMEGNMATSILVGLALVGIIYFGYKHYRFLVWNISEYKQFKATEAFQKLKNSNAEVSLDGHSFDTGYECQCAICHWSGFYSRSMELH